MNLDTTQSGLASARNLKLLLLFVAMGVFLSLGTYFVAGGFERISLIPALVLVLLAPAMIAVGATGLRQGWRYFRELGADWTWWHWTFLLLVFSTLVFRERDNSVVTSNPIDAAAFLRIVPEMIVVAILYVRAKRSETSWRQSLLTGLVRLLAAYATVCLISSVWSVYPAWTAYKSFEYLLDVTALAAFLACVKSEDDIRKMCNLMWMLYGLDMVWAWANAVAWPQDALDELGRLQAVWPQISYNSLGASSSVVTVVALSRLLGRSASKDYRDRAWYLVLLFIGIATLIASQTRNAMAGLVVGIALLLFFERKLWIGAVGALAMVPLLIFTSLGPKVLTFLARDQTESQIVGMSSRVDWWTFAWQQFQKRPLTGYGAYAAGKFAVLGKLGIAASQIHSDWLETLSGSSLWGLLPFVAAFVGCWIVIGRSYFDRSLTPKERGWLPEVAAVFAVLSVRSFFNVEMCWHAPLLYFSIVAYAEFVRRERPSRLKGLVPPTKVVRRMTTPEPVHA